MMDQDYDLFAAIVNAGSLSAAGRALGLSPAMVSKRLQRLERRLGVQLLHRSTRSLSLTSRGRMLHEDLERIMAALDMAEKRISAGSDVPAGPLHVSAPTSFGRMHLAPYLAEFLDLYPDIRLTLNLSDGFTDLMAEQIDVAIRITDRPPTGFVAHRLATSERVLCASPSYLARHGEPRSIDDLAGHRMLAASGQLPWRLTGPRGDVKIDGESHVDTNSSEVVRELAIAGSGIALRSLWDVNDALANGNLRRILPDVEGSSDIAIYAIHPPAAFPNPALTALLSFLNGLYRPEPPWRRSALSERTI